MLAPLLDFTQLCRQNGLRISTAEVLDLVQAVELVGLADRATLRAALEATLCKTGRENEVFAELFDLYFQRRDVFLGEPGEEAAPLVVALRKQGVSEEEIEHLLAIVADEAARMQPLARMGLGLRRGRIEALIRLMGIRVDFGRLASPLQIGFFTQQLLEQLNFRGASEDLSRLKARLEKALGGERAGQIAGIVDENLQKLRTQVRSHVAEEFERRQAEQVALARQHLLSHKPFGALTDKELFEMRHEVTRLGKKLRAMSTLRKKTERRGRLDARRTLRRALRSGGVPFEMKWRRRRLDKPRLVVLCDVSDSVRHVSRFMLQLAFTLQELFGKVRSFIFVSDLAECTDLFRRHELQRAVDLAYAGGVVNVYANSNFGRALRLFHGRFLEAVTARTTVIVIGDGRNNYNPSEAWALGDVKARARRVLWLNPEPKAAWMFGDSAMREYEPHCHRVEHVGNLAQLAQAIDDLVL